jgi:hypothetical protein
LIMASRASYLFWALLLLTGACSALLIGESWTEARRQARAEDFQHVVGGVGFGTALDLSGCAFSFDPRLDQSCGLDSGPVPGGSCFCPRHAGSIFYYAPLGKRGDHGDAATP